MQTQRTNCEASLPLKQRPFQKTAALCQWDNRATALNADELKLAIGNHFTRRLKHGKCRVLLAGVDIQCSERLRKVTEELFLYCTVLLAYQAELCSKELFS